MAGSLSSPMYKGEKPTEWGDDPNCLVLVGNPPE